MEIIIPLFIILAIVIWLVARGMDTDRVKEYIEARGGKLLEKHWAPFGKGWFGEKSDRIYEVRYLDKEGNEHQATCKTSMWTGVYWTEDTIVKYARRPDVDASSAASLEEENRRLREENERLRRGEA
jgi:hypothetical protein